MPTEGISKNELKEILTEVIRAVKEPTAIEQKKLDAAAEAEQAKQEARKRQAGQVLEQLENTKAVQQICSHAHKSGTRTASS